MEITPEAHSQANKHRGMLRHFDNVPPETSIEVSPYDDLRRRSSGEDGVEQEGVE